MKITKVLTREIGQDVLAGGLAPVKKNWITAAIAGGSALMSLGSSLFGGAKAKKAAERQQSILEARQQENDNWHRRKMNENYVDTQAGNRMVTMAKDTAQEMINRSAGAQAVAGGTTASEVATKEAAMKQAGNVIANISANDTARKDAADAQHQRMQDQYAQQQAQLEANKAQATADAASAASNAIISAGSAIASGLDGKANLAGGSNKGVDTGNASDSNAAAAAMGKNVKWV